jgi:hypothetical protein
MLYILHDMTVRRNTPPKRPKGRKESPFVPRYIPVREVLKLYDLPKDLVAAGYLADAFTVREPETQLAYNAWKGALGSSYSDSVCQTLMTAKESDFSKLQKGTLSMICKETPEIFLLKLAMLISQGSSFRSLSEDGLNIWKRQTESVLAFRGWIRLPSKLKVPYKEMRSYLKGAHAYITSLPTC